MKTKLSVSFLKEGFLNTDVAAIVSAHNGGKLILSLDNILGYALTKKAFYPSLLNGLTAKIVEDVLLISEDNGETFAMTISERIVMELTQSESDLLVQSKLS